MNRLAKPKLWRGGMQMVKELRKDACPMQRAAKKGGG